MIKCLHIALCMLLLSGCYKDEIDLDSLNDNPFDRDYKGPAPFYDVQTSTEWVTIQGQQVQRQVITFRVNEELFLSPVSNYAVHVQEIGTSASQLVQSDPPGSNRFKYYRLGQPLFGVPVCLEARLANNQSIAGANTICATL
jgi:hypothetical protein